MGQAFNAFFMFLFQLFGAAEKGASAINNLATWADESSGVFVDEARHNRAEKIKKQAIEAAATQAARALPPAP